MCRYRKYISMNTMCWVHPREHHTCQKKKSLPKLLPEIFLGTWIFHIWGNGLSSGNPTWLAGKYPMNGSFKRKITYA